VGEISQNRWWIVVASAVGLTVGAGAIYISAFGVLLKPIAEDLGIGRGVFSSALLLLTISQAAGCVLLGFLLDRYGLRRIMIPGLLLYAASVAMLSTLTSSVAYMYLLYAIAGTIAAVASPVPYGAAVVAWFDRSRGIALGLAIGGVGLGAVLAPPYVQYFVANFGWRQAYLALAAAILMIGFLPVALFLRNPPRTTAVLNHAATGANATGIRTSEAIRSKLFWTFIAVFAGGAIAVTGSMTHVVPLLTDRGVAPGVAVAAMAMSGVALTLGRLAGGWCLDRYWGPYIAALFFACPLVGIPLILYGGAEMSLSVAGVFLIGLGLGAEVDFLAFFASRYFGPLEYAKKYGIMFPAIGIGAGVGPTISGATFDYFHSYVPAFAAYTVLLAIICVFFVRLGPYRFPAPRAFDVSPAAGGIQEQTT
jgi:MFS family permease